MIIVIRNSLGPRVPEWIKAVSSGDDDDGVAADDGGPASCPGLVQDHALPRELVLHRLLSSPNYPAVGQTTA